MLGEVANVAVSNVQTVPCLTNILPHLVLLFYDIYYLMYNAGQLLDWWRLELTLIT